MFIHTFACDTPTAIRQAWHLKAQWLRNLPSGLILLCNTICAQSIAVFCMDLKTKFPHRVLSDFFFLWRFDSILGNDFRLCGFAIAFSGHTTLGRTPLDRWSARSRGLFLKNTTPTSDIHALGGIRTHNPNNQAALDPCLGPLDHLDRQR